MKNIKRLTALVLTLLIFALTLPTVSVFAADSDARYGRTKLTANQQYVYDAVVAGIKDAKNNIVINIKGKNIDFSNDLGKILDMAYNDYPEYFWFSGGWGASVASNSSSTLLNIFPNYTFTGSALSGAKTAYNSKVAELTKGLDGKSDYEKSKILHDRLAAAVDYTFTSNDQNAYGALVEGKAVCSGYARAYQHLMNKAGIPTWFVTGTSYNPTTGAAVGHAWNIVKLDGKWYYTDVTWDDQGETIYYEYLNITTDKMDDDHTLADEYKNLVPAATSTAANYYKIEGREFTKYDQTRLVELLKKDSNKTQIYVDGDVNAFINSVGDNLLEIGKQLGGKGSFSVSSSYSTLKNAVVVTITLINGSHTHSAKTTVKQENATCLANGTKAHYICDCGLKFSDSACTKQINDNNELVIPAKSHIPSGWKNDATNHWKECTTCGTESANTRSEHTDKNKDNKCDTCSYALPIEDESGNIVVDSGTNSNTTNNNTSSTTSKPTNSSKEETTSSNVTDSSDDIDNTDTVVDESSDDTTDENNIGSTLESTSEIIEIIEEEDTDSSGLGTTSWIIIIVAAIVSASGTVFIIMYFKK